jgi:hypothetical protein
VTNPGGGASNGLTYLYQDTTTPKFLSFTVSKSLVVATFSKPVCHLPALPAANTDTSGTDWTIRNVSAGSVNAVTGTNIPQCTAAKDNGVTDVILQLTTPMPNGAFVEVTLNGTTATRNANITDSAGNTASAPQARQATATAPDATAPTLVSASGTNGTSIVTLTFSKPVQCLASWNPGTTVAPNTTTNVSLNSFTPGTTDPSVTGYSGTGCGATAITATSSWKVATGSALPADKSYSLQVLCAASPADITDIYGNALSCPAVVNFTTGAADLTPPVIIDARIVANVGSTDFLEVGDAFSLTFSKKMNGCAAAPCSIDAQDQDGTTYSASNTPNNAIRCGVNVSCVWNTAVTTVTVTVTTQLVPPALGAVGAGTTAGMQIPFNITAMNGINDVSGNPPNVLGSPDRLVRYK